MQLGWLDSPHALEATVQRLKDVKSIGIDVGLCVYSVISAKLSNLIILNLQRFSRPCPQNTRKTACKSVGATSTTFHRGTSTSRACSRNGKAVPEDFDTYRCKPMYLMGTEVGKSLTPLFSLFQLGERLFTRQDCRPYFEAGCIDIIQPDISHSGGISETRRIATMAETYDIGVAPHCPLGMWGIFCSFFSMAVQHLLMCLST